MLPLRLGFPLQEKEDDWGHQRRTKKAQETLRDGGLALVSHGEDSHKQTVTAEPTT